MSVVTFLLSAERQDAQSPELIRSTLQRLLEQSGLRFTLTPVPTEQPQEDPVLLPEDREGAAALTRLRALHTRLRLPPHALQRHLSSVVFPATGADTDADRTTDQITFLLQDGWDEQQVRTALGDAYLAPFGDRSVDARLEGPDHEPLATLNAAPWLDPLSAAHLSVLLTDAERTLSPALDDLLETFGAFDAFVGDSLFSRPQGTIRTTLNPRHLLLFVRSKAERDDTFTRLAKALERLDPEHVTAADLASCMPRFLFSTER